MNIDRKNIRLNFEHKANRAGLTKPSRTGKSAHHLVMHHSSPENAQNLKIKIYIFTCNNKFLLYVPLYVCCSGVHISGYRKTALPFSDLRMDRGVAQIFFSVVYKHLLTCIYTSAFFLPVNFFSSMLTEAKIALSA